MVFVLLLIVLERGLLLLLDMDLTKQKLNCILEIFLFKLQSKNPISLLNLVNHLLEFLLKIFELLCLVLHLQSQSFDLLILLWLILLNHIEFMGKPHVIPL